MSTNEALATTTSAIWVNWVALRRPVGEVKVYFGERGPWEEEGRCQHPNHDEER
jgi:hypothetical protein